MGRSMATMFFPRESSMLDVNGTGSTNPASPSSMENRVSFFVRSKRCDSGITSPLSS